MCMEYTNAHRAGGRTAARLSAAIRHDIGKTAVSEMSSVLKAAAALKAHGFSEPVSELYNRRSAMIVELMEAIQ